MPICPYQKKSQQMIMPFVIARSILISLRMLSLPLPEQRVLVETFVDKSSHQIKALLDEGSTQLLCCFESVCKGSESP
jgi:hypothetical protein